MSQLSVLLHQYAPQNGWGTVVTAAGIAGLCVALVCAGAIWLYQRRPQARKQRMLRALRTTPDKPPVIKKSDADVVREIVNQSLVHGMEILSIVELIEAQNTGGVNKNLAEADLENSLIAIRNAM